MLWMTRYGGKDRFQCCMLPGTPAWPAQQVSSRRKRCAHRANVARGLPTRFRGMAREGDKRSSSVSTTFNVSSSKGGPGLFDVTGRDDRRLHRVFRRIARVAGDDAALVKRAVALVGASVGFAAIAAAS